MEEEVQVSVVIPAYNAQDTLEDAVLSVLEQTFSNLEVIVVDDGSTDNTPAAADALSAQDSRVRVLHKQNGGVSAARNDGIRLAKGIWLVTLDDDDYLDSRMIEQLYEAAVYRKADLSLCGIRLVYPEKKAEVFRPQTAITADRETFVNLLFTDLYDRHLISTHSNKLYNLAIIRKFGIYYDTSLSINEDLLFCLQYMRFCDSIAVIRGAYMNYVQHAVGESLITTFREDGLWSCFKVLEACNALFESVKPEKEPVNEMNNRMLMHICSFLGLMYYRSDYEKAKEKEVLSQLCQREDFQHLLSQTAPVGLKNKAAHFLLQHRFTDAYDALCRLLYLGKREKESRTSKEMRVQDGETK